MTRFLISQAVDVHSYPPNAQNVDGSMKGDEHVHSFNNLIPACEFAVSLAKEGHLAISVVPEFGPEIDIEHAHEIVGIWESGKVSFEAEEIEL